MWTPDRRQLLRAFAVGGAGAALGCATAPARPARPRLHLPPVRVSPAREIRTVVGLRPYRPEGFVVRAEKLGDKLVVHNYGHGGGGVTLSWGTADLACKLALESPARRIAVLGCGAVGLATARLLQLRGASVTVYAAALPPDTTSNIAGAQVFPFTVFDGDAATPAFREQFTAAARFTYQFWQSLVGPLYGVRWMDNYSLSSHARNEEGLTGRRGPLSFMLPDVEDFPDGTHPFPTPFLRRFATMMVEPSVYLPAMMRDVRLAGADLVVRRLSSVTELATLSEPTVMNCTGLGAAALFGDPSLVPLKGQLHVLMPQPEVDYAVLSGDLYMFARRDGILLGGTREKGISTLEPNEEAHKTILEGHARLFAAMSQAQSGSAIAAPPSTSRIVPVT